MIEYLRRHHQLVRAGAADEGIEAKPDRFGRTDNGAGERIVEHGVFLCADAGRVVFHRRRQFARPSTAQMTKACWSDENR